jgi:stage II sporulation protein D
MTLFYRKTFFFLFLYVSLHATHWPLVTISDPKKSFLSSKNKLVTRSRMSVKKAQKSERAHALFTDVLPLHINIQCEELKDVFLEARKQRSTKVRVLLAKAEVNNASAEWKLACPQGFVIQLQNDSGAFDTTSNVKKTTKASVLIIKIKQGVLFCNGKRVTGTLQLKSIGGCGECNGIVYDGDFIITRHKDTFLCINQVELEDYICAVLRTESWPGWPLEVNKVFAIACRSYVMFKTLEARRTGRPYHVKNTNAHQTYRGKHEVFVLKTAVEQTRGVVLGFKGSPILAMFDCCCGGVVPAYIEDFDFAKVPYLARNYACNFCKQSSLHSWQVSYEHAFFESLVQEYTQEFLRLSDIHVIKKDKAGLVTEVKLKGPKHATVISGKKLYSLLKEVKSFHFDIQKKSGKIIFSGRGFGHHLGLCQWGARQMVRDGWDYKSILRFYYPGAYFMHLI